MQEIDCSFYNAIQGITEPYYSILSSLDESIKQNAAEIRLKAEKPLIITLDNKPLWVCKNGVSYTPQINAVVCTKEDINKIFLSLCENSVYAHEDEIKEGFISLKYGHRAGICGTKSPGGVRDVSSITIRIARQIFGCADGLFGDYKSGGLLIAGPPGCGKTTLLRDLIFKLSKEYHYRVSVVDTRGEIAASHKGVPQLELGDTVDVFSGFSKPSGIQISLRTQNPQIIAFDELGDIKEVKAIADACGGGADIITTVHAGSEQELFSNPKIRLLLNNKYIKNIALLNKNPGGGHKMLKVNQNA